MSLEDVIRKELQKRTSLVIQEEKETIAKIKKECYLKLIETNKFPGKEEMMAKLLHNWYTSKTLRNVCDIIYTLMPEEAKAMYGLQKYEQELNEENEAAYQNLISLAEEFQKKVANIAQLVEQAKLGQEIGNYSYSLLRTEFRDKQSYVRFFTDFYTTYFHAFKPQLNESKVFFQSVLKVRRLVTAKEADKIFLEQN